jgi:CheY-like chemotaxis protein
VKADPAAVDQALINLVVNSRDAMPRGGHLAISIVNHAIGDAGHVDLGVPAGDWVRVDVTDTGVGIEEQSLGRVFEPFYTTKGDAGGTGLGLATVFGSMSQAGGHVRVRSTAGAGATFSLFFPRLGQLGAASDDAATAVRLPVARPGEVVLLVDDESAVRSVTARLLHDLGYAVLRASGGDEAFSVAAAHAGVIHAIVSDLVMPDAGGVESVANIRRARPRMGVVMMSGFSETALEWRSGALPPGTPLLRKPFTIDELARAVRTAIDATRGTELRTG